MPVPSFRSLASSPTRIVLTLIATTFLVELVLMFVLPSGRTPLVAILDATLLAGALLPFFWIFIVRPLRQAALCEKARAEERRSLAERDWERTFNTISDIITIHDSDFNIIRANRAAFEKLGLPAGATAQAKCFHYFHGASCPPDRCATCSSIRTGQETITETFEPHLNMFVETRAIPRRNENGEMAGLIHVVRDITKRKQLEQSLEQQKQFAEDMLQNLAVAAFVLDPSHRVMLWNRACEELTGVPASAMLGTADHWRPFYESPRQTLADIVIDRDHDKLASLYSRFSQSWLTKDGLHAEGWYLNLNGRNRYLVFDAAPVYDRDGKLLVVVETLQDIPERKRIEDELERSETKLRTIIEAEQECVKLLAEDGTLLEMNPAGLRMIDADSADQVVGRSIYPLISPGHRDQVRTMTERVFRGEEQELQFEIMSLRGARRWVETKAVPLRNERHQITALLGVTRDISERRRLEEQLQHVQKMEALGTLTGGIAHDFNNILTSIVGFSELVTMNLPEKDPSREYVDQILASAERAAALTQNLLAFSRKQLSRPEPTDINEVIRRVEGMLVRLIGEHITLRTDLARGRLNVIIDRGQLEQVLVNLAVNARDAMTEEGSILIATDVVHIDQAFLEQNGFGRAGVHVHIVVADTGAGMDRVTRQRVFEPFFTTKDVGKGTGLGLSIVFGIVEQHGGFIDCRSEPGRGTAFHLYFPVAHREAEGTAKIVERQLPRGTETVLVVEDEQSVRKITEIMLESLGYRVLSAADGAEGLRLFTEQKDRIDIVLLDVIMPGMNGGQVLQELRRVRPEVKSIFMSGYAADVITGRGSIAEADRIITKPVLLQELALQLRGILDSASA